jgi:hypothetical protein
MNPSLKFGVLPSDMRDTSLAIIVPPAKVKWVRLVF